MAFGGHYVLDKGFGAGGAITQFRFVELVAGQTDPRQVQQVDGLGDTVIGVCQETITAQDATDGRIANIALIGVSLVESGGAVTQGAKVRSDASGRAVALDGTAGVNDQVAGIAFDAATGAGEWISVLLTPGATSNTATT